MHISRCARECVCVLEKYGFGFVRYRQYFFHTKGLLMVCRLYLGVCIFFFCCAADFINSRPSPHSISFGSDAIMSCIVHNFSVFKLFRTATFDLIYFLFFPEIFYGYCRFRDFLVFKCVDSNFNVIIFSFRFRYVFQGINLICILYVSRRD